MITCLGFEGYQFAEIKKRTVSWSQYLYLECGIWKRQAHRDLSKVHGGILGIEPDPVSQLPVGY